MEFTDEIQNELCLFANRITPPNWIISTGTRDHRFEGDPGTLNINLEFHNQIHETELGACENVYIHYGAAFWQIRLYLQPEEVTNIGGTYKGTLIHELAHVAAESKNVCRRKIFRDKSCGVYTIGRAVDKDCHGPAFNKELRRMLKRALAVYSVDDLLLEIRQVCAELDDVDAYFRMTNPTG